MYIMFILYAKKLNNKLTKEKVNLSKDKITLMNKIFKIKIQIKIIRVVSINNF